MVFCGIVNYQEGRKSQKCYKLPLKEVYIVKVTAFF
nr:MAG TPA: hypothetical protein [Caudoviricetes sp.]